MLKNRRIGKPLLLLLIVACLYGGTFCGGAAQRSESNRANYSPPPVPRSVKEEATRSVPPQNATSEQREETTSQESAGVPQTSGGGRFLPLPVDRQLAKLHGRLSFNTPKQMQMSKPTRIVLVLARTGIPDEKTPEQGRKAVRKRGGTEGKVAVAEDVRVAERVRARLTGKDFEIEARDSEVQPLISKGMTAWKWDVTPTKWGKKTLHLSVEALLILHDRDLPVTVRSYDRDITVNVTMTQRAMTYASYIPESLWVPVFLAIGAALVGWWKGWWSRIWARIRPTPPSGNPPGDGGA